MLSVALLQERLEAIAGLALLMGGHPLGKLKSDRIFGPCMQPDAVCPVPAVTATCAVSDHHAL